MKAIVLYACAIIFLCSCQKEVFVPQPVKVAPEHAEKPEAEPEPEPETSPEPELEPETEEFYLRDFPNHFTAEHHYRLVRMYTDAKDLSDSLPLWAKDDIHTFNDFGDGTIVSTKVCPEAPFSVRSENWSAYGDEVGIRLTWVDVNYNPVTYVVKSMNTGKSFTVYEMKDEEKIYLQFALVSEK